MTEETDKPIMSRRAVTVLPPPGACQRTLMIAQGHLGLLTDLTISITYTVPVTINIRSNLECFADHKQCDQTEVAYEIVCPFDAHCCHTGTAIKHHVPDRVKPSFVIFDIQLSVRVPDIKNYK